jgi:hypothetical protein
LTTDNQIPQIELSPLSGLDHALAECRDPPLWASIGLFVGAQFRTGYGVRQRAMKIRKNLAQVYGGVPLVRIQFSPSPPTIDGLAALEHDDIFCL